MECPGSTMKKTLRSEGCELGDWPDLPILDNAPAIIIERDARISWASPLDPFHQELVGTPYFQQLIDMAEDWARSIGYTVKVFYRRGKALFIGYLFTGETSFAE